MCHAPAECFNLNERGYIREGYFADLVLLDKNDPWTVSKENILYKCGWSIFEGNTFSSKITHTFINGCLAYQNGQIIEGKMGQRVTFQG
jgi:dihydroorotase